MTMYTSWLVEHSTLLADSYRRVTGRQLIADSAFTGEGLAGALFEAPFVLVSHNTAEDPLFNYGNRPALQLFELDWDVFIRLPSRLSAEAQNREERQRLMTRVTQDGFIDDYRGIRVSSTGKRFWIENATVWNIIDARGDYRGQAAMFHDWTPITD